MENVLAYARAVLSTTPERWQRLVTLPIDLLTRRPLDGEWSAYHCLQHLVDVERLLFPVRVRQFLAGQNFVDFDPNGQPHAGPDVETPELLLADFTRQRQESLTMLEQVSEDDLERTVQHPKLGTVTLRQMLHTWAGHDLMHTVQAERALMQPFMQGSGPWRGFFQDHELKLSGLKARGSAPTSPHPSH
jgi:hypothetical protein